jgi:hypothetical protein
MSKTTLASIPCRSCGAHVVAATVESANPARHAGFQDQLLARTFLRMACQHCGEEHLHYERFMWSDLPARLCVVVLHESERAGWADLEQEVGDSLSVPFREEGPPFVRAFGETVSIRLAFGLEELREKVVCRIADLDDRVVEAMKEDLPYGAVLEAADPGSSLTFVDGEQPVDVGWAGYEEAVLRRDALAAELPGLFDPLATWVNAARSRRAPAVIVK